MSLILNLKNSFILFALILIIASSISAQEQTNRTDGTMKGIEKIMLADGVYQFKASYDGYVEDCNSTVFVNKDDVLVFDTNTRPSTARAILAEIRKITNKPVKYVVNSHWHPDHWSGNEVYAQEFPNLEIIATEETQRYMRNIYPAWPAVFSGGLKRRQDAYSSEVSAGKKADGTPLTEEDRRSSENILSVFRSFVTEAQTVHRTLPNRTYHGEMTLNHGGREFRFMSFTGDASNSTVLYLPKEKMLVTGDLLVYPVTWTTQSYQITPWMNSLKALSKFDVNIIVPGHGPTLRDKNYINLVAELFESTITQVEASLTKGAVTVDDVKKDINLSEIRLKFTKGDKDLDAEFEGSANSLITKVYQEARDGMTSRR